MLRIENIAEGSFMKDFNRPNYHILHAPSLIERGAALIEDRRPRSRFSDADVLDPNTRKYHEWRSNNPVTPHSGTSGTNTPSPVAPSDGKTYTANTEHFYGAERVVRTPSETKAAFAMPHPTTPKDHIFKQGSYGAAHGLENDGASPNTGVKHSGNTNMGKVEPASSTPKINPDSRAVRVVTSRSTAPTTPKPF